MKRVWLILLLLMVMLTKITGCNDPESEDYRPLAAAAAAVEGGVSPQPTPASDECPNCRGRGKLGDGTVSVICPMCNGTGKRVAAKVEPPAEESVLVERLQEVNGPEPVEPIETPPPPPMPEPEPEPKAEAAPLPLFKPYLLSAGWCTPCRILTKELGTVAWRDKLITVDVDEPRLKTFVGTLISGKFSIPRVVLTDPLGKPLANFSPNGASDLERWLDATCASHGGRWR